MADAIPTSALAAALAKVPPERLAALRAAHAASSRGPYRVRRHDSNAWVEAPEQRMNTRDDGMGIDHATQVLGDDQYPTKEADMAWTVAAHAALPDLFDALAALLALLDPATAQSMALTSEIAPEEAEATQPAPHASHNLSPWGRAQASLFRTCRRCHGWQRAGGGTDALDDTLREPCDYA